MKGYGASRARRALLDRCRLLQNSSRRSARSRKRMLEKIRRDFAESSSTCCGLWCLNTTFPSRTINSARHMTSFPMPAVAAADAAQWLLTRSLILSQRRLSTMCLPICHSHTRSHPQCAEADRQPQTETRHQITRPDLNLFLAGNWIFVSKIETFCSDINLNLIKYMYQSNKPFQKFRIIFEQLVIYTKQVLYIFYCVPERFKFQSASEILHLLPCYEKLQDSANNK